MLFSPNKGHSLNEDTPKPTIILNNGKQAAIVTSFHPANPLMYDDCSLEAQMRQGIQIPTMESSAFFKPSIENSFDTIKQLNESAKTL